MRLCVSVTFGGRGEDRNTGTMENVRNNKNVFFVKYSDISYNNY